MRKLFTICLASLQIACAAEDFNNLKSATPFPKCYLHKEKWTFDS